MARLNKRVKTFINAFRKFIGLDHNQTKQSGFLADFWHNQHKLAQSPNAPRTHNGDHLNRGYSAAARSRSKQPKYSAEEVKRILRGLEKGQRAGPVLGQAAVLGSLLDERMVRYFRGRERMFHRLTYVVFQYTQGRPCDEIAQSVSYFSDGQDVEEAVEFAARLIAYQVNRHRH